MDTVSFKRTAPGESRIHDRDGDHLGDVRGLDDPLRKAARYFVVHLFDDPRGPVRVHDRRRVRETARRLADTHPFR